MVILQGNEACHSQFDPLGWEPRKKFTYNDVVTDPSIEDFQTMGSFTFIGVTSPWKKNNTTHTMEGSSDEILPLACYGSTSFFCTGFCFQTEICKKKLFFMVKKQNMHYSSKQIKTQMLHVWIIHLHEEETCAHWRETCWVNIPVPCSILILLLEEIPNNHLGCKKPYKIME